MKYPGALGMDHALEREIAERARTDGTYAVAYALLQVTEAIDNLSWHRNERPPRKPKARPNGAAAKPS
jgi:hypothetical protein